MATILCQAPATSAAAGAAVRYLGRLFLVFLMASALMRASLAGTERQSNLERVQVEVILWTPSGWQHRKSHIYEYIDGHTVVCREFKDKVEALCLVLLLDDNSAVVVPTRLLEEKT